MKKLRKMLACIAAAMVAAFSVCMLPVLDVSAETTSTSSVMEDLQESASFSADDYPEKTIEQLREADEAFLQVIRIAESTDNKLYVYVYQPSDATTEIEASKILIGQTINESSARVYDLTLASTDGVFDKYLVNGLEVLSLEIRNYTITSIFRPFNDAIDEKKSGDNKDSHVAVEVAQTWYVRNTADGRREYAYTTDEVITITDKWLGSIRYSDGFKLIEKPFTDSHFIAFTTDHKIEELLLAEVTYTHQKYDYAYITATKEIQIKNVGEPIPAYVKIKPSKAQNAADGWFSHVYEWERIESISSFISNESGLSSDAKANLQRVHENANGNGAWVIRFVETQYSESDHYRVTYTNSGPIAVRNGKEYKTTRIENVAILKLTFRTDGVTYTMGVVDSMTSSDNVPDGEYSFWDGVLANFSDTWNEFQRMIRIAGLVLGGVLVFFAIFGIIQLVAYLRLLFGRNNGGGNAGGT